VCVACVRGGALRKRTHVAGGGTRADTCLARAHGRGGREWRGDAVLCSCARQSRRRWPEHARYRVSTKMGFRAPRLTVGLLRRRRWLGSQPRFWARRHGLRRSRRRAGRGRTCGLAQNGGRLLGTSPRRCWWAWSKEGEAMVIASAKAGCRGSVPGADRCDRVTRSAMTT
jgi:hypothetical protein